MSRRVLSSLLCSVAISLAGLARAASTEVQVTSDAEAWNSVGTEVVRTRSNTVRVKTLMRGPVIQFFTDNTYSQPAQAETAGTRMFIEVQAPVCNRDASAVERVNVVVWSAKTLDKHIYTAVESTPQSGTFRVPQELMTRRATGSVDSNNGDTTVDSDDTVIARLEGCGDPVESQLLIDPSGVVFDTDSKAPVAGASVALIDLTGAGNGGNAGGLARVFSYDGVTRSPSQVVTAADGRYTFPLVAPSSYALRVVPPRRYDFPSSHTPAELSPAHRVSAPGSYGGAFPVNASTGNVMLDIPLDPRPGDLRVQLSASRTEAEIAESVEYVLTVRNVGDLRLESVDLRADLPAGFRYVAGSAFLDGARVADPRGGAGPSLTFPLGPLAAAVTRTVRLRALIGPGALQGDGITRAEARSSQPVVRSNLATAQVKVQAGIFTDKATVLGTFFADCNANGLKDAQEPGVPGVTLYLEDGSFVTTDSAGRYSFYGIRPRTHVLKVDATTLPPGARLAALSQRHAGDGNSRFIDVKAGELHRADFALARCSPELLETLRDRSHAAAGATELGWALRSDLKPDTALRSLGDVRGLPASGRVGPADNAVAPAAAASAPVASVPLTLAQQLSAPDREAGFMTLSDNQVMPGRVISLRIKGQAATTWTLEVNGRAVGEEQIGERVRSEVSPVELREYVGVALDAGTNVLTLTERDGFGNVRHQQRVTVQAPGPLARLQIRTPGTAAPSDGTSRVSVEVALRDAHDLPVTSRTPVTLETTLGEWATTDLNPSEPGVQTFVEGGRGSFELRAPFNAGDAQLRASSGGVSAQAMVSFAPALRPMLAMGVVEGALNLRKLNPKALVPTRANDGFEEELRQFASGRGNDSAGGRAALFLKGKVRGDYLLTLGYDSDKDTRERLFRDIQPDEFYPVYGDASTKGFDAQSTGRLYVRIEKNKSYTLYGDYTTQTVTPERQLGAYQRSLTGVKQRYEDDKVAVTGFASRDRSRQEVLELRGNGTSGPYVLSGGSVIANSERVEILVRDRNQPALVLKNTPQVRFSDYEFEPFTGQLLFRAPVPSLDADLNPVSVRITYEVEQGGPGYWVQGAEATLKLDPRLAVGASVVSDRNPLNPLQLSSLNLQFKPDEKTRVNAEMAETRRELIGTGEAQRVDLQHDGDAVKLRAYAGRSSADFDNPSSTLTRGRAEAGVKASLAVNERTRVVGEVIHTADAVSGNSRDGTLVGVERSLDGGMKVEAGLRSVQDNPAAAQTSTDTTSVRAKVSTVVPGAPKVSVYAEAEQDVNSSDKHLLALGGEYQMANRGRLYLRDELISSLTGPYELDGTQRRNTTVLGMDTDYMRDGRLFTEYRGREAFNGREAEAAVGLRNQWNVAEGVRVNTSVERVQALAGDAQNESAAVTGAVEYTYSPQLKSSARLELRNSTASRSALSTVGVAYKVNQDWTMLSKGIYTITESHAGDPDRLQLRMQLGMAYRDTVNNVRNGLSRYEFKREAGLAEAGNNRNVHSISSHLDYQVRRDVIWTVQHAAKWVREDLSGSTMNSSAHLLGGRVSYEIRPRWDVGGAVRLLADGNFGSRQTAVGAEVGHLLKDNLWLSAGYNVTGFHDRDLSAENYTDRGAYLRVRFKFDETVLDPR